MDYLLGIDIGTTNTKAVVYSPHQGEVVAVGRYPTRTHHPRPGWSEFDPAEIWQGVVESIRQAIERIPAQARIAGIGISSMGEAGVLIDQQGQYLYPIIVWYDPRSEPQIEHLRELLGAYRLFEITGQAPRNIFSLSKMLWLRDNRPEVLERARKWLCMEDFVIWKLSGEFATDYSVASRTLAFDQRAHNWSSEILDAAGVTVDLFPVAHPSGTLVGQLSRVAAAQTGLEEGVPVVTGGHDHLCGALAVGVIEDGQVLDSTGTAEAVLAPLSVYRPDRALFASGFSFYHYVVRGRYVVIGGLSAGGGSIDWLARRVLGYDSGPQERFFDLASRAPAGSAGLMFLPHLMGSGTPEDDSLSRGAFVGLTAFHGQEHFARAALEGLCYWLRTNLDEIELLLGQPIEEITAIGGATQAPLWLQLKTQVTGRRVRVPSVPEAVAVGAALLAGCGIGLFSSEREAAATVRAPSLTQGPSPNESAIYRRYYQEVYRTLYPTLREVNKRIHQLTWSEPER